MLFKVEINEVRPIRALEVSLDLERNAPLCIVGRNGAGKTTLAKAIMNFVLADTFSRTTSSGALGATSTIRYTADERVFDFTYDPAAGTLSTRQPVPKSLQKLVTVELPIPHGLRFSYFHTLADADDEIRVGIILENDTRPVGLIDFLTNIYGESRFENLREIKFSRGACCFFRTADGRYIREDYFSSGEFFLVNLYRRLQSGVRLVFVDEIDISLDAAAQARLVAQLRVLCSQFSVNVVFTSHSLAIMQTLRDGELLYLEAGADRCNLEARSFSYVKSVMFGFQGWDRYILVEDESAKAVVEWIIASYCAPTHHSHFIIEVGGAGQVISLLQRNRTHGFLGPDAAVIAVLDGDQKSMGHANGQAIHCMPLQSVEAAFEAIYEDPQFAPRLPQAVDAAIQRGPGRAKALYKAFRRSHPGQDPVDIVCAANAAELKTFANLVIKPFLSIENACACSIT
jgi:energy-coupling factor transporter ATP-binding protein EcfA2